MTLDGRFRLRAPLRCDGVGRLDWGEDLSLGGRVAVRWVPVAANGEAAVSACAQLPVHPVLPQILQIGRREEMAFVVIEFPDGELLSSRLADGDWLDERGALSLGAQLAQALALVHRHRLVHGELGAGSVLFGPGERILFWDVPLVFVDRMTDRRAESRPLHQLVKTAASLAPEIARGGGPTEAGDVYSLAAVLCLSTGAPPPPAPSTIGVLHQVATGAWVPRVTQVFPERVAALVRQMLDPEATARPSAAEVAAVFAQCSVKEMASTASESTPSLTLGDGVASEGLRFAVIGAVIGVLAALALALGFLLHLGPQVPPTAPPPAKEAQASPTLESAAAAVRH